MITIFEEYHKYIPNQIRYQDLKKGDYVLVTCPDLDVDNEVVILTNDPELTNDGFVIHAKGANDYLPYHTYYDYEIVKKLTPNEVEFYSTVKKYNL